MDSLNLLQRHPYRSLHSLDSLAMQLQELELIHSSHLDLNSVFALCIILLLEYSTKISDAMIRT
jgi:hypothetical protein